MTTRRQVSVVLVQQPGRVPLRLLLGEQAIEVGRDCSGLVLTDPKISRRHLSLQAAGELVRVTDLGSRNGTFVDGTRVESHLMVPGNLVRLGGCTISLADAPVPAPQAMSDLPGVTSIDLVAADAMAHPAGLAAMPPGARTLTVVFSDLHNAARDADRLGTTRWRAILAVHNAIVRRQAARYDGVELRSHEDGFLHGFSSARRAVSFVMGLHRALEVLAQSRPGDTMRARAGAHSGEPLVGSDLTVSPLAIAARVAGAAHGGELLVTGIVRDIVEPAGDVQFGTPRLITLRGFELEHLVHPVSSAPLQQSPSSAPQRPAGRGLS